MKFYLFPPSTRALGIVALQISPSIMGYNPLTSDVPTNLLLNTSRSFPTKKMPTLEDDGFVLCESNAILFCMPARGTMRHGA